MDGIFCSLCLGIPMKMAFIYMLDFDKGLLHTHLVTEAKVNWAQTLSPWSDRTYILRRSEDLWLFPVIGCLRAFSWVLSDLIGNLLRKLMLHNSQRFLNCLLDICFLI